MCNCTKADGFKAKLSEAQKLTNETGETHVVYVHKAVNMAFVRKETDLNDELGICCYYTPDGKEVEYVSKASKKANKKTQKEAETATETDPAQTPTQE